MQPPQPLSVLGDSFYLHENLGSSSRTRFGIVMMAELLLSLVRALSVVAVLAAAADAFSTDPPSTAPFSGRCRRRRTRSSSALRSSLVNDGIFQTSPPLRIEVRRGGGGEVHSCAVLSHSCSKRSGVFPLLLPPRNAHELSPLSSTQPSIIPLCIIRHPYITGQQPQDVDAPGRRREARSGLAPLPRPSHRGVRRAVADAVVHPHEVHGRVRGRVGEHR